MNFDGDVTVTLTIRLACCFVVNFEAICVGGTTCFNLILKDPFMLRN